MKTATRTLLFCFSLVIAVGLSQPAFAAKTLTLGSAQINSNADEAARIVTLDLTAAGFNDVNGLVFTMTYDADVLEFIGLVQNDKSIDNSDHSDDESAPSSETIAGTIYYQTNESAAGRVLVAAAGAEYFAPSAADYIPFKAQFRVLSAAQEDETYKIDLKQTTIGSATAGNAGYGSNVELPVAAGLKTGADPVSGESYSVNLVSGGITVSSIITDVVIDDKPTSTLTIKPGDSSAEFSVSGGDSSYTWSAQGPVPLADTTGDTYVFHAPSQGSFAGEYTITVTDSANTNSESFKIYVPLAIDPEQTQFVVLENGDARSFTVSGAAIGTAFSTIIDSLDDDTPDQEITGEFSDDYTAVFQFNPSDYQDAVSVDTGTKQYTIDFNANGYERLPQIDYSILPLRTISGFIVDDNQDELNDAVVSITSPSTYADQSATSGTGTGVSAGEFVFSDLPATLYNGQTAVYEFKVEKKGYLSRVFKSTDLNDEGTSRITMNKLAVTIAGMITNPDGDICSVILTGDGEIVSGPISAGVDGTFSFNLETVPEYPAYYTIKAGKTGWSGAVTITLNSSSYEGAEVTMSEITSDIPKINGEAPSGNKGVIDSAVGGNTDLSGEEGLDEKVASVFGDNKIKVVIVPSADGGIVNVALPASSESAADDQDAPETIVKWEISGLDSGGCAIIPVPFNLSDSEKIRNGELVVLYAHESDPTTWKVAEIEGEIDYVGDGVTGIASARICGWSSNEVGLGADPESVSDSDSDGDGGGGGCFIFSLFPGTLTIGGMSWITAFPFFTVAALLISNRKQKISGCLEDEKKDK